MKKNMRILVAMILVITTMAVIAGCGSSTKEEAKPAETKTEEAKTEEVTTEAPEAAASEKEIEVVEIDPETYMWSDDEKIVYENGSSTVEYFKGKEKSDKWLLSQVFNESGDLVATYKYDHSAIKEINSFIKLLYECKAQAESFGDNANIIESNEPATEMDLKLKEYSIPSGMRLTYTKGDDKFAFYEDNGTIKFANMDGETTVWSYPVDDTMKLKIAYMVWFADGDTQL